MSLQSETPLGTNIELGDTDSIVDANFVPFEVSGSAKSKKISWANIKATLETYFDTIYLTASNNLSDLANALTARNNLKLYEMFITTGDQTTTSNVATNITGLVTITLEANKHYYFDGLIHLGCNNTGGVKLQVTVPTGATLFISGVGFGTNVNTSVTVPLVTSGALGANAVCTGNSPNGVFRINGEVKMSSTTGVVQFGFASGTNTQTSTIYQLGSVINYEKLN